MFEEEKRLGGGGVGGDFGPDWSDHKTITEDMEGGSRGSTVNGAVRVIGDLTMMEK